MEERKACHHFTIVAKCSGRQSSDHDICRRTGGRRGTHPHSNRDRRTVSHTLGRLAGDDRDPLPRGACATRPIAGWSTTWPTSSRGSLGHGHLGAPSALSIRWLTIHFLASGRTYHLEFGEGLSRLVKPSLLRIEADGKGNSTALSTGSLRVEFLAGGPSALGKIASTSTRTVHLPWPTGCPGAAGGDHYYRDGRGQLFSSAGDGADRQITVEEQGPVRAYVPRRRFLHGTKGRGGSSDIGHAITCLRAWGLMKIVNQFGVVGSTRETKFADIGLGIQLGLATQGRTVSIDSSAARTTRS